MTTLFAMLLCTYISQTFQVKFVSRDSTFLILTIRDQLNVLCILEHCCWFVMNCAGLLCTSQKLLFQSVICCLVSCGLSVPPACSFVELIDHCYILYVDVSLSPSPSLSACNYSSVCQKNTVLIHPSQCENDSIILWMVWPMPKPPPATPRK